MTGEGSGTLLSPIQTEQAGMASLIGTMADKKVRPTQLVVVAQKIGGIWDQIAAWLSPELFSTLKVKEIERDHGSSFSRARAVLELWSNELDHQATCRLLIQSLCQTGQRAVAAEVFGSELVQFVNPSSLI